MTAQRVTKEPKFSLLQKITLFLLILAGMNFLSRDRLICFFACVIFLVFRIKFFVNRDMFTLLLFSVSWVIFAPADNTHVIFKIIKPFAFPLAYCVGLNFLSTDDQEKSENNIRTTIIMLSVGPFTHFFLNFLYNFGKTVDRSTNDFWSGETLSATIQAALSLMVLVIAVTTLFTNTRFRNKVLSVITLVMIFLYNLTLAGRTFFAMLILVFAVSLLFLMLKGEKKSAKYKTLLIIMLVILMLVILYNANAFGIQETIKSSNFYNRFFGQWSKDLDDDSRLEKKLGYLEDFGMSIWGGVHLRPIYGYAHDILLDTYDEAGIIALVAMLMFLGSAVIRLFSCLGNRNLKFETQQLILAMYVAILVQFMIEPIMQGLSWMFMLFCFIHGMVTRLDRASRQRATYLSGQ